MVRRKAVSEQSANMGRLRKPASEDDVLDWVEQVAKYVWDQDRMPMICDPPEQTAGEIAQAISASRASLTNNLRLLAGIGFLGGAPGPGIVRSITGRTTKRSIG